LRDLKQKHKTEVEVAKAEAVMDLKKRFSLTPGGFGFDDQTPGGFENYG
jgi:hypothetical protein